MGRNVSYLYQINIVSHIMLTSISTFFIHTTVAEMLINTEDPEVSSEISEKEGIIFRIYFS